MGGMGESRLAPFSFRRRCCWAGFVPSFLARDRAYLNPHLEKDVRHGNLIHINTYALHNSFLPLGPFRHSGLEVALQLEHFCTPVGLLPAARPDPG